MSSNNKLVKIDQPVVHFENSGVFFFNINLNLSLYLLCAVVP
jgi:hypothetical protein